MFLSLLLFLSLKSINMSLDEDLKNQFRLITFKRVKL